MPHLDLVTDLLERVRRRAGVATDVLRSVEREARAEWGGARHYLPKACDAKRMELMARDNRICADHARLTAGGMETSAADQYLALRHGLSVRRIRQITRA